LGEKSYRAYALGAAASSVGFDEVLLPAAKFLTLVSLVFLAPMTGVGYKTLDVFPLNPLARKKPVAEPNEAQVDAAVHRAATLNGLDPALVKSIILAESGFNQSALSPKGAIGLMQLMPETAEEMGFDPNRYEQNISAGSKYLSTLLHRYKNHRNTVQLAIAAYNAGPGNVDRYHGVPPFRETRGYVKKVLAFHRQLKRERCRHGQPRDHDADEEAD
jgi:soluble lytic murein transglycosylase-like protein